ncbi:hypothetical protein MesoLj113b_70450 (plasmid) [Mesorhizobium sp. 113-3-3]|nr:hypothetical protein MesoLj113b_70450 [Mesorhizobium sp. 113-3-3]
MAWFIRVMNLSYNTSSGVTTLISAPAKQALQSLPHTISNKGNLDAATSVSQEPA